MPSPWREEPSIKASNQTIDDTTLVSLGVEHQLRAGRKYQFWGTVLINSPAADDAKFAMATTGTITGMVTWEWAGSVFSRALDGTATGLMPQGGSQQLNPFWGFAVCTADGVITLQGAKQADTAGTTTTIYADGTVFHMKVMS